MERPRPSSELLQWSGPVCNYYNGAVQSISITMVQPSSELFQRSGPVLRLIITMERPSVWIYYNGSAQRWDVLQWIRPVLGFITIVLPRMHLTPSGPRQPTTLATSPKWLALAAVSKTSFFPCQKKLPDEHCLAFRVAVV